MLLPTTSWMKKQALGGGARVSDGDERDSDFDSYEEESEDDEWTGDGEEAIGENPADGAGEVIADARAGERVVREVANDGMARNRVKWGALTGVDEIGALVQDIHAKITTLRKNIFDVPRSQAGKNFVAEAARLLKLFNTKSAWESVAVNVLVVFFPLMLQKPGQKSKASDHSRYLTKRLQWWKDGKLKEIMSEAEEIQKRLPPPKGESEEEDKLRGFTRLMMEGKVKQALKLVNTDNVIAGVHVISDEIRASLQAKHPDAAEAEDRVLLEGDVPRVEEVIFEDINAQVIQATAKKTFGSGGPTRVDADTWKHILCSKAFGKLSNELAEQVAVFARRLCTSRRKAKVRIRENT